MNKITLQGVAVTVIAGAILVPLAWNYIVCPIVNGIGVPIINAVRESKRKKLIEKGLKDGSVMYFDGTYYRIPVGLKITREEFLEAMIAGKYEK